MKDIKFRKIGSRVNTKTPSVVLKEINNIQKMYTIKSTIEKSFIRTIDNRTYIKLHLYDSNYFSYVAVSIQDDEDILDIIDSDGEFLIEGMMVEVDKELKKMFRLTHETKVLIIKNIEITKTPDSRINTLCGLSIAKLHTYNLKDSYDFLISNFEYMKNFAKEDIKNIKFTTDDDEIKDVVLLKNGDVYIQGKKANKNIKEIAILEELSVVGITNEMEIIGIIGDQKIIDSLNNNGCKYKKIYIDNYSVIGLTYESNLIICEMVIMGIINPKNLMNVDDIGVLDTEKKEFVIIRNNKCYDLYSNIEYDTYKIGLITNANEEDFKIVA